MSDYKKGDASKWPESRLLLRLAQAGSVPQIVTDNPVEFEEIHFELHRRQRNAQWRLAIGVALISGVIGLVSAGFQELMGWGTSAPRAEAEDTQSK